MYDIMSWYTQQQVRYKLNFPIKFSQQHICVYKLKQKIQKYTSHITRTIFFSLQKSNFKLHCNKLHTIITYMNKLYNSKISYTHTHSLTPRVCFYTVHTHTHTQNNAKCFGERERDILIWPKKILYTTIHMRNTHSAKFNINSL